MRPNILFIDEICQQPKVLRDFVALSSEETALYADIQNRMKEKEHPHFVFTGMGSSLFVCFIAQRILQNQGITVSVIESSELCGIEPRFFTNDMIIVAVSQSGESPEVIELVQKLPAEIPVIGITNYPKSRLHQMTAMTAGIYAGTEYLTSTKSYTNSLAALLVLAYRIVGTQKELDALNAKLLDCADKMETMIREKASFDRIADFIRDIQFLVFVGSGYSYTTACHGEIVAEEVTKFHSSVFTPAQFIHGPIEMISDTFGVVVLDFERDFSSKCDDVRASVLQYGGKVLLLTNRDDVAESDRQMVVRIAHADPETSVLLEIMPLELALDSLCNSRGVKAGQITRVVKRMAE